MFHSRVVQGMALHFDFMIDFLVSGAVDIVAVICRSNRDEFRHIRSLAISIQFISQITQEVTNSEVPFAGFGRVKDRVSVEVQNPILQFFQEVVESETGVGRHIVGQNDVGVFEGL